MHTRLDHDIVTHCMNYIGSKKKLLTDIERMIVKHQIPFDSVLDIFSGTGIVSEHFKHMGFEVYSNDWQYYSYILSYARLMYDSHPTFNPSLFEPYTSILGYLNELEGKEGLFYHAYCEGGLDGRIYFSKDNGRRMQAIRDQINTWEKSGAITTHQSNYLIASFIFASDKVANTASVYGAYLKKLKPSAKKDLFLVPIKLAKSKQNKIHHVYCENALTISDSIQKNVTLTYLDPPYNARQYSGNYHILETLAKWDLEILSPRGISGLRTKDENNSLFCKKRKAEHSFKTLLSGLNTDYILFSYNNEGLLNEDTLTKVMSEDYTIIEFSKIDYQRFRSDKNHAKRTYTKDKTEEFLVCAKRR